MDMSLLVVVLLVLLLLGVIPIYPYSRPWGYSPAAVLVVILVLVLLLRGRL